MARKRRTRKKRNAAGLRARWAVGPCWDSDDIPIPDDEAPDFPWEAW
jgi:hypothetical protein